MIIIRYAHPEVGDNFICKSPHHDGGIWQSGRQAGHAQAIRFAGEAAAKAYLAVRGYDLPPLKVTFEPVEG